MYEVTFIHDDVTQYIFWVDKPVWEDLRLIAEILEIERKE